MDGRVRPLAGVDLNLLKALDALLQELRDANRIAIEGVYPFEQIRLITPTEGLA